VRQKCLSSSESPMLCYRSGLRTTFWDHMRTVHYSSWPSAVSVSPTIPPLPFPPCAELCLEACILMMQTWAEHHLGVAPREARPKTRLPPASSCYWHRRRGMLMWGKTSTSRVSGLFWGRGGGDTLRTGGEGFKQRLQFLQWHSTVTARLADWQDVTKHCISHRSYLQTILD
jgi:hypothetical protein